MAFRICARARLEPGAQREHPGCALAAAVVPCQYAAAAAAAAELACSSTSAVQSAVSLQHRLSAGINLVLVGCKQAQSTRSPLSCWEDEAALTCPTSALNASVSA